MRPEARWIPIAVLSLVGQEAWDRAQAQPARNAALSFRNDTRRDCLLRCRTTEVAIAARALNRMLELGRSESVRVA